MQDMSAIDATRIRTRHFARAKSEGRKISCLTAYDAPTAAIFDEAGIDLLLVGDSAANVILGQESTLSITVEEMMTMATAVARATRRAFVVTDLPFGSYEASPAQALATAVRFMKTTGVSAVKIEGGVEISPTIRTLVDAGIPVMAHIGYTPQSEHALGGYVVQGRGEAAAQLRQDALAVQEAGAFAVVLEMVPAALAAEISTELAIPTIGIGAGSGTDGQVLVWTDAFGLTRGNTPRFARKYADVGQVLLDAARSYISDVADESFPNEDESFQDTK